MGGCRPQGFLLAGVFTPNNRWSIDMLVNAQESNVSPAGHTNWLKRMGLAGFMFFFLKGMAWLIIPWLAHSALL
jgi:hypothetical protein